MNNDMKRPSGTVTLPGEFESDKEVIRLLREERLVVHFDGAFEAYVTAPGGIVHEFPMWYNDHYAPEDGDEWQRTSIDPLTLKRELSRREFSIEAESPRHKRWFRTDDE